MWLATLCQLQLYRVGVYKIIHSCARLLRRTSFSPGRPLFWTKQATIQQLLGKDVEIAEPRPAESRPGDPFASFDATGSVWHGYIQRD